MEKLMLCSTNMAVIISNQLGKEYRYVVHIFKFLAISTWFIAYSFDKFLLCKLLRIRSSGGHKAVPSILVVTTHILGLSHV